MYDDVPPAGPRPKTKATITAPPRRVVPVIELPELSPAYEANWLAFCRQSLRAAPPWNCRVAATIGADLPCVGRALYALTVLVWLRDANKTLDDAFRIETTALACGLCVLLDEELRWFAELAIPEAIDQLTRDYPEEASRYDLVNVRWVMRRLPDKYTLFAAGRFPGY